MKKILNLFLKILLYFIIIILIIYGLLWVFSFKTYSLNYGISFDIGYTQKLKLDWQETYLAILNELKPTYLRLSAPWDLIEKDKGIYDFSTVDYLMNEALKREMKVTLVVGQKVPRWPECHLPSWSKDLDQEERGKAILSYIEQTVKRYRNHSALEFWQVENEPFIKFQFGECSFFDPTVVNSELILVRSLDPKHSIVVTDSGELSTWFEASKAGDILGTTLYRTVRTPGGMIFTYDWLPPAFYKFRAWFWGKEVNSFYISELQAEPWFGSDLPAETSISKMEQTLSPNRLLKNINYAKHLGASRVYFWGAEWWYFMKKNRDDSRYWNIGRSFLDRSIIK